MGVNENTIEEIYNERAHYLFNIDELLLERLGEQVPGKKISIHPGFSYTQGIDSLDRIKKIKVVDQLSTSGKYKIFDETPELIANKKFEPLCLKKIKNHELQDFDSINEY